MERKLHILSIGGFSGLGESNTCLQRNRILQTFGEVDQVDTTAVPFNLWYRSCNKLFQWGLPISLPDLCGANKQIKEKIYRNKYDIIWISTQHQMAAPIILSSFSITSQYSLRLPMEFPMA